MTKADKVYNKGKKQSGFSERNRAFDGTLDFFSVIVMLGALRLAMAQCKRVPKSWTANRH